MRAPVIPIALALALAGCRTGSDARRAATRYIVTAAPLDVGVVSRALCIAVDPQDEHGVWWWEPGASGCGSRSTGPGVFPAERAAVGANRGARPIDVGFRLQLKRAPGTPLPDFADVHLVVEADAIRARESGARVAIGRRTDLAVPAEVGPR